MITVLSSGRTGSSLVMQTLDLWGYNVLGQRFEHPAHNPQFNRHGYFEVDYNKLPQVLPCKNYHYSSEKDAIKVGGYGLQWLEQNWGLPRILIHTTRFRHPQAESLYKYTYTSPEELTIGEAAASIEIDEGMFTRFKEKYKEIPVCVLHVRMLLENPREYFQKLADAVGYKGSLSIALLNKEKGYA